MASRAKPAAALPATSPSPSVAAKSAPKRTRSAAVVALPVVAASSFLRFYLTPEVQSRLDAVLTAIEQSAEPAEHGEALADVVAELTDAGLSYYYLRALKAAKVGFVVEQSTRLAVSGAGKLISSVCRKYLVSMDDAQLLAIAGHIRELSR